MSVTDSRSQQRLTELAADECRELLSAKQVGRLAYLDESDLVVVPVNYVVHDGVVFFRTSPYSSLALHAHDSTVAFEVDEIDDATHSGWSVLIRGEAEYVDVDDLPTASDSRPRPWPAGVRNLFVRIQPRTITGRRLLPEG